MSTLLILLQKWIFVKTYNWKLNYISLKTLNNKLLISLCIQSINYWLNGVRSTLVTTNTDKALLQKYYNTWPLLIRATT